MPRPAPPSLTGDPQPLPEYTAEEAEAEAVAFSDLQERRKLEKVRQQLTLVHEAIHSAAAKGLRVLEHYNRDLCAETLAVLQREHFQVKDLNRNEGECCSNFEISWGKKKGNAR
jgi:hypothetical protein